MGSSGGRSTGAEDSPSEEFWRVKKLGEMTPAEWESLCDGCGRCCVLRFHYGNANEAHVSDVACRLLDTKTGGCGDYPNRLRRVKECRRLTPEVVGSGGWLPTSCAYRLVAEGRDLFFWHHLKNGGDRSMVHKIGVGVAGRVINARRGLDPEDRIVEVRKGERG